VSPGSARRASPGAARCIQRLATPRSQIRRGAHDGVDCVARKLDCPAPRAFTHDRTCDSTTVCATILKSLAITTGTTDMTKCIFCQIVARIAPAAIWRENEHAIAFPTIEPVGAGHMLVIPKRHAETLFDLDDDEAAAYAISIKNWGRELMDEQGASAMNFLNASGKDAQQSVFHLHFHLVPRRPDDGLDLWIRKGL
jgi:histidine triad (HIT) family protein